MKREIYIITLILLLIAVPVYADIIWPAMLLEGRIVAWWAIIIGLACEFPFVKYLFNFSIKKSLVADLAMNLASTILGFILIPVAGLTLGAVLDVVLYKFFHIYASFNPISWTATFLFAVAINAGLESMVISRVFHAKVGKRGFWGLFLANTISVAVAFASIFMYPPKT